MVTLGALAIGATPARASTTVTVEVGQTFDRFTQADITIQPGDKVHWNWDASGHSVTSGNPPGTPDGVYDSGVQGISSTYDQAFTAPGVYHYFCKIHYAVGMVGTITVQGVDPAPTAAFTASTSTPDPGQAVSFDASGSTTPDGDVIQSYAWDFGDGTPTQTTTMPSTSHSFATSGPHTVTLTITDSGSATNAVSHLITVKTPPDTAPTASFAFSPPRPAVGQAVTFDGSASADGDGDTIASYRWSFGDGTAMTTTRATVSHTFTSAGTDHVQLIVVDSRGSPSAAVTRDVVVTPPIPRLSKLTVHGCLKKSHRCRHPDIHVHFILSMNAKVSLTITLAGHKRVLRHATIAGKAGGNSAVLGVRKLAPGRYVLKARPAGGKAVVARFRLT